MDYIKIDDFKRLDIRIGEIKEVKEHPNADKLYVLSVDLGTEKRQLVAGIKSYYTKEELLGKQVVVLVNLMPMDIRGIESQGMILASKDDSDLSLICPERKLKLGSIVK